MTVTSLKQLDERDVARILEELRLRKENYLPQWDPGDEGPGYALAQAHARYLHALLQRLNQVPEKLKLAFLETIGLELTGAQPARTVLVFQMAANGNSVPSGPGNTGVRAPERTQVAGEPPPGSDLTDPVVFETERALGLTPARIRKVVSLWPGRDQYIDHTEQLERGEPFRPFERTLLKNTPHELYIAHERLLALAGTAHVELAVELRGVASEHLQIAWQYWDGDAWRELDSNADGSTGERADGSDGTEGLRRSGQIGLVTDCAEAAKTTIDGIESYWIRGMLEEPLVPVATRTDDSEAAHECGPPRLQRPASGADVNDALPEIGQLRLSTIIKRDLEVTRFVDGDDKRLRLYWQRMVRVIVTEPNGDPLSGAEVTILQDEKTMATGTTTAGGVAVLEFADNGQPIKVKVRHNNRNRNYNNITRSEPDTDHEHGNLLVMFRPNGSVNGKLYWNSDKVKVRVPVRVRNTDGQPVTGAVVTITTGDKSRLSGKVTPAGTLEPEIRFEREPSQPVSIEIRVHGKVFRHPVTLTERDRDSEHGELPITLQITGLLPDTVIGNGQEVDLSTPFAPFGPTPQPGSVLYLSSEEAFGKPGAEVDIHLLRTRAPADQAVPRVIGRAERGDDVDSLTPVPGVKVEILSEGEPIQETATAANGTYAFAGLPDGTYQVRFSGKVTAAVTLGSIAQQVNLTNDSTTVEPASFVSGPPLAHTVNWEYWDGSTWSVLKTVSGPRQPPDTPEASDTGNRSDEGTPDDFGASGAVTLKVPIDLARTEVQGQEALWIRARLASGGYGYTQQVSWKDESGHTNHFSYVVHQPPIISGLKITYVWQDGPRPADHVLTYNDFEYTDQSEAARAAGESFLPFTRVADVLPALYLGLDKRLPVDRVGMYFNIAEVLSDESTPAIQWEFWNGFRWHRLAVEDDGTAGLARGDVVSLIGPRDAETRKRFAQDLYWLRARMTEDGPPFTPEIRGLHLNAIWASQRETVVNQPLGTSSGLPNQIFTFPRVPVLDGEQIEVRELTGERANVQWRILVRELFDDPQRAIRELERQLASETRQREFVLLPVRLRRMNNKKVGEVWVRWQRKAHLFDSDENDRHYMLEPARGRVFFGDGRLGMIPPLSSVIQCRRFATGGGLVGNIAAGQVNQLLGGVAGVEAVFNARPSEGGADGESLTTFSARGPRVLRHRGRAVTVGDYETMAREASPAVAVAHAAANLAPSGYRAPGRVTLVVIPHSEEPRPEPSSGLREKIRSYIAQRSDANLQTARQVYVNGPQYWPIDVAATVAAVDPAAAGAVEAAAREAVSGFLHPLHGGPRGQGWPPGRSVYLSDLAAVLERTEGVDYVRELTLLVEGTPQGESAFVPAGRFAVAGDLRIKLVS